jgi:hypothetical protein
VNLLNKFNKNVLLAFFSMMLFTYACIYLIAYINVRLPYFDGSHHFSELMNYALLMQNDFFHALKNLWVSSPELFAQYTLISILSNVFFYDRTIFLIIYFGLFLILLWKTYFYSNKNFQILYILLVTSTMLLSYQGGILDSRIDAVGILIFSFAIISVLKHDNINAFLLIVIAVFFKSSMLFLATPFIVYVFWKIIFSLNRCTKYSYVKFGLSIGLLSVYFYKIFIKSISYNLMSTGGANAESSLLIYFSKLYQYITQDFYFYGKFLLQDPLFVIITLYLFVKLLMPSTRQDNQKLILSYFAFFVWTYLLMTSNPIHERVLLIWFYPLHFFGVLIASSLVDKTRLIDFIIVLLIILQSILIVLYNKYPSEWKKDYYTNSTKSIKQQTNQIAEFLDSQKDSKSILILVNFLSNHGPVSYNYDVYRVLLHENLRDKKQIHGWELSTYGSNWKSEVTKLIKQNQNIIFILQESPMGIPQVNNPQKYGQSNYLELLDFQTRHPECMIPITNEILLPHMGTRTVYFFYQTDICMNKLQLQIKE